jgi:hypothetical protein
MKHTLWLLLAVGAVSSCVPDFQATEADRLYLQVSGPVEARVKLFTYAAAYANSPDFVTLETPGRLDTLCRTDNLEQVAIRGDTVHLAFTGAPSLYTKRIRVAPQAAGHLILVDTSGQQPSPRPARNYFKL